ncbi:MAG: hypothetical protein EBV69_11980, partial [Oxalobacteraceae bacterium]|nr:hypothetical protein [Oxalobacteraceae bacterium]
MNGAAVNPSTSAGIYNASYDSATDTATFQTQFYDGQYTKVVFVKLQKSGSDVQALSYAGRDSYHTVYVADNSGTGTTLGNNFTTATYTSSTNSTGQVATSASAQGYGVESFQISSKVVFTGNNTYTGTTTTSNNVTSRNSGVGAAGIGGSAYFSQTAKGTIQLGSGSASGSLSSSSITNNGLLILNRSDDGAAVSSNISGSGNLIKIGSGSYTLSGTNTHTGNNIVYQGTLKVGSATALGASLGAASITSGAVLDLNG